MTDRELLEAAAKAAGLNWRDWTPTMFLGETELREWPHDWNPLEDDGDALRLAVKLGMSLDTALGQSMAIALHGKDCLELHGSDSLAATRRAIVRAAASLGSRHA